MAEKTRIVKVSSKGWVVIPKEMRDRKQIKPGNKVLVKETEAGVTILPLPEDPIRAACGFLRGEGSLVEALLRERAKEREREEKMIRHLQGEEE